MTGYFGKDKADILGSDLFPLWKLSDIKWRGLAQ